MVSIIIKEWTTKIGLVPAVQKRNAAVLLRKLGRLASQYAVSAFQCINLNFESHNFKNMTSDSFYEYVKQHIRSDKRMYLVDIGLRNYLLGFRDRDSGHAIENVVYFELLRRGYDVAIGKVDNSEVDFIATKADDKLYVQVTESMISEDVRMRELAPLQKISDNYEKIVLSLNTGMDSSYDGIKSINLIDWLISE